MPATCLHATHLCQKLDKSTPNHLEMQSKGTFSGSFEKKLKLVRKLEKEKFSQMFVFFIDFSPHFFFQFVFSNFFPQKFELKSIFECAENKCETIGM